MNELVRNVQQNLDVPNKIQRILTALDDDRPVLLKIGFDPGWQTLKDAYAFTHSEPNGFPSHTDAFNNRNPEVVKFSNAMEFAQIYGALRNKGHAESNAIRVGFKNDQRKLSAFVIDTPEKMTNLLRQMTQFGSKPFDMGHDGTIHNFPRCFYFGPDGMFKVPGLDVFNRSENVVEFGGASIGLKTGLLYLNENQRAAFNTAESVFLIASPSLEARPVAGQRLDIEVNAATADQFVAVNQRHGQLGVEAPSDMAAE